MFWYVHPYRHRAGPVWIREWESVFPCVRLTPPEQSNSSVSNLVSSTSRPLTRLLLSSPPSVIVHKSSISTPIPQKRDRRRESPKKKKKKDEVTIKRAWSKDQGVHLCVTLKSVNEGCNDPPEFLINWDPIFQYFFISTNYKWWGDGTDLPHRSRLGQTKVRKKSRKTIIQI